MRLLPVTLCLLLLLPVTAAEAKPPGLRIHVLSNRADLLSAGDALVRIERRVRPDGLAQALRTGGTEIDVTPRYAA